ncbi:UNVERIFIED_CONTAM: hypothetical protein Sindi_2209400 [Sesamum indicum]
MNNDECKLELYKPALNTTYHPQNPIPRASNHNYSLGSFSNVENDLTPMDGSDFRKRGSQPLTGTRPACSDNSPSTVGGNRSRVGPITLLHRATSAASTTTPGAQIILFCSLPRSSTVMPLRLALCSQSFLYSVLTIMPSFDFGWKE